MTVKMPVFRRHGFQRTTPKLTLLKKELQKSPQHSQKKRKRVRLVLFLAVVVILQVVLLRSVKIENQIHDETAVIDPNNGIKLSEERNSKSSLPFSQHQTTTNDQVNQFKGATGNRQPSLASSVVSESSLLYSKPPQLNDFPQWIQDYVQWHQKVRQEFPGMELFDNPNAPPLLIRTCLGLCGGLHDRIGQLPWDLYLAHKTKRLLLISWQRPRSLENFLLPSPLLDWRVPSQAQFGFDDIRKVRNETQMFEGFPEANPTDEFFQKDFDIALERAMVGSYSKIRVLRHRFLGHLYQDVLEERLLKEELMPDSSSLHIAPLFGKIFWLFFRPSPPVHAKFVQVLEELQLTPQAYTAVHCRVRHPKAFSYGATVLGKNPAYPADKTGLPWEGETREAALGVALKALQCAKSLTTAGDNDTGGNNNNNKNKVYFLSDSNDLVSHICQELPSGGSSSISYNWTLPELQHLVVSNKKQTNDDNDHGLTVLSRDPTEENAHIDRQKGRPPEAYYDTFVDLLVVMHAQCVVYGVGYYAAFGAKISGTPCQYIYQKEAWGAQSNKEAEICPDGG
ncbi:unnamed protein product [Cylindrotheca closterium]|uniref:Uncharacterized protein n=1 Tax=Cylindrotheca closterium TaxID=2856 RepID=A0AAD2FZG5_9STRA|nr:unnamed protein product [Cylindrotheca closterium]